MIEIDPELSAQLTNAARARARRSGQFGLGGASSAFAAFAYAAETDTLASSFSVAPTTARKKSMDTAIKRLKAAGVWTKCVALHMIGADENASLKNWKAPGTYDLIKNGTPTFTADDCWLANANGQYLNTQVPLSAVGQDDHSMFVYTKTSTGTTASTMGAVNASSIGISIVARNSSFSAVTGRSANATATIIVQADSPTLGGLVGVSRDNSANFQPYRNGVPTTLVTSASQALTGGIPVYLLNANANNAAPGSFSTEKVSASFIGAALTAAQAKVLHAVMREYVDACQYGDWTPVDVGISPATVSADCVAYGATAQSVLFALQAARAGKTVAIVGGWRDRHIGGMSAGGLGYTDFDNIAGMGGLPRWLITRMNAIQNVADTTVRFRPRNFTRMMNTLLDPTKNGGFTIPVYWSNGVQSVAKTGTAINSITTADGRIITALQWFDGSYEGDLLVKAGGSYTFGREAAGSLAESRNGYRGVTTTDGGDEHQFKNASNVVSYVDPWITPGVPASGLVNQVHGVYSTFTPGLNNQPALGTADTKSQSYNFRVTMTSSGTKRVPLPSTPPSGFAIADYELLLRHLALNPTLTMAQIFKPDTTYDFTLDVNAINGFSTDKWAANHTYPTATYAEREVIWKDHWNWILGLFYVLQYYADARVPAGLRTSALTYGLVDDHFMTPHPNDDVWIPPQLYVRECVRMVGDVVVNGNHLAQTDGATPTLGTKTISVASYAMDSHSVQRVAYEYAAGQWGTWNEGNFFQSSGGANALAPIPLEIAVPKAAELTNLSVGFAVSATHVAFGSIRMEYTAMQIGQSMGQAAAQAINGATTIQAVDYSAVRTALLASASLSGEVAPVLPQTT